MFLSELAAGAAASTEPIQNRLFLQFGDGDGDGGDDGFFRKVFKELYDAKAIQAVLQVGPDSKLRCSRSAVRRSVG